MGENLPIKNIIGTYRYFDVFLRRYIKYMVLYTRKSPSNTKKITFYIFKAIP